MNSSLTTDQPLSIGQYLIQRLHDFGIRDVFGIPGDYILQFYTMLEQSPLRVIGTTREDCAGFAADAYARVHGMGAVCVTYCVGGLSICNSVAGAYAEKSPLVVISGAPGLRERTNSPLLHHMVRDFRTQLDVMEKLCVTCTDLSDPTTAFREIDRVLDTCARIKRPVFIEIPRDMVDVVPQSGHAYQHIVHATDPAAMIEAVDEACHLLQNAKKPLILAGIEIHRFGLQDQLLELAEKLQIPIATTLLGKSVIGETHPLFAGIYEGAMGRDAVTRFVEESDCVLVLGAFMTDINLGIFTANLDPARCIYATSEKLRIRHHHYHDVVLGDFIQAISARRPVLPVRSLPESIQAHPPHYKMVPDAPIQIIRLVARLNQQLDESTVVIADIGDSLFAATELVIHARTEFLSPAYYTSMGFSVPAALGVQVARPEARVVVICGDGAFQMTGMELSNMVRHGFDPIVIVLDNGGYGTERMLHDGTWKFNDIHPWRYHALPQLLGGGRGYEVRTEQEFDVALTDAWANRREPSILHVYLSPHDHSQPLQRLAERLGKHV
ncbi:MAG: thiamine pyrophosphate-binding protein [Planctomycetota bacterium]|nr:thiamine pyrophosphate-binding protein [Planctomycetota bacterium]MDA1177167.1 thiamine pyrophosphate-binding protein [Planctomycetota bacterium]